MRRVVLCTLLLSTLPGLILTRSLRAYDRRQQEEAAMLHKWENYSWGLLPGLLAGE